MEIKKAIFIFILLFTQIAIPCTGIYYGSPKQSTFAQNIGWYWNVDTALVINPHDMKKSGVALYDKDPTIKWVSLYGSVTLNPLGREFPISGINEKGLIVQGLQFLEGRYPTFSESSLPALHNLQWIQYQLDISKNVQEAIANAQTVRPTGIKPLLLHYMICDSSGACAHFEYQKDGKLEIYSDADLPFPVLTNTTYSESVAWYEKCVVDSACLLPDDSLARFIGAIQIAKDFTNDQNAVDYGFSKLPLVQQPYPVTSWNLVLENNETGAKRFHIKGIKQMLPQHVDLSDVDLSCRHPIQMQQLDLTATGDVSSHFSDFTSELQERLLRQAKSFITEQQVQTVMGYVEKETPCQISSR